MFQVVFLPPNTTSLLQPMDQQIISNFKKSYTKKMFDLLFEKCEQDTGEDNVIKFWKEEYDIRMAIMVIARAWKGMSARCLSAGWKPLLGESQEDADPEEEEQLISSILQNARRLNMEVEEGDIEQLIREDAEELTVPELQELAAERDQAEQRDAEVNTPEEVIRSADIKRELQALRSLRAFYVRTHPQREELENLCQIIEDTAMPFYNRILKQRERQPSIRAFLTSPSSQEEPSSSTPADEQSQQAQASSPDQQSQPGPSGLQQSQPGPSGLQQSQPGPSGQQQSQPGPSGLQQSQQPGPSGLQSQRKQRKKSGGVGPRKTKMRRSIVQVEEISSSSSSVSSEWEASDSD